MPRAFLRAFAADRPRSRWRRASVAALNAGLRVTHEHTQHLWRDEDPKVPCRRRTKRLSGIVSTVDPFCPICPDVVWAADFQVDRTREGTS